MYSEPSLGQARISRKRDKLCKAKAWSSCDVLLLSILLQWQPHSGALSQQTQRDKSSWGLVIRGLSREPLKTRSLERTWHDLHGPRQPLRNHAKKWVLLTYQPWQAKPSQIQWECGLPVIRQFLCFVLSVNVPTSPLLLRVSTFHSSGTLWDMCKDYSGIQMGKLRQRASNLKYLALALTPLLLGLFPGLPNSSPVCFRRMLTPMLLVNRGHSDIQTKLSFQTLHVFLIIACIFLFAVIPYIHFLILWSFLLECKLHWSKKLV